MANYGLIGRLQAQPGKGNELAEILLEASRLMENAAGCKQYMVALLEDDADAVQIIEVWDSREDHDNSLAYPGVKELIGRAMPLLSGSPKTGIHLSVLGGHGLNK
ncbi:putative quinol monooxygenase [Fulvivirga sedimenti]|uniref:Antibiotic biosynthesis monooxygenase n=1 Tax=Fulvivirga sedimenti TaxID=2879465 RepID=A0A9X1L181_9BACT|nr:antibiotic biosynthesis monooxygenase family protein [Fulvivirga sedimenti]MCA6077942.1 antibiotic biosynthesis monooxygenase [Fulvivirga sedimenti]